MTSVALLGDVHIGARSNSPYYATYLEKFFKKFLDYLDDHNIRTVLQLGDLFDSRTAINLCTLYRAKKAFFDELEKRGIRFICLVGNHDSHGKDSLVINSPELLLKQYFEFEVISEPRTIEIDGCDIDIIPWICPENAIQVVKFIKATTTKVCMGHFQLVGFEMDPGSICNDGLDKKALKKYKKVFSGHFHHRSEDGNINYIGNPTQITWIDYGDKRGFSVFDTKTHEIEFIPNDFSFFEKLVYDDTSETDYKTMDYSKFAGSYVKVLVVNKTKPAVLEAVLDKLNAQDPADVQVFEELVVVNDTPGTQDSYEKISIEDTVALMENYVDEAITDVDPTKLKQFLRELYIEAQAE